MCAIHRANAERPSGTGVGMPFVFRADPRIQRTPVAGQNERWCLHLAPP